MARNIDQYTHTVTTGMLSRAVLSCFQDEVRTLSFRFYNNGDEINLSGVTVGISIQKEDGTAVGASQAVMDYDNDSLREFTTSGYTANAGVYLGRIERQDTRETLAEFSLEVMPL